MESKFKIIKMNIITTSFYDLEKNTDCTICRCNLNENSLHSKDKCMDSVVVTGGCGHSFHYECISPWVKNQPSCPICSCHWLTKK